MSTRPKRPPDPVVEARTRGQYAGSANAGVDRHHLEPQHRPRGPPDDHDDADAYSIRRFCERHNISEAFFYKLRALGLGPVTMRVGSRVLVSRESAAAWRRAREMAAEAASPADDGLDIPDWLRRAAP